MDFSLAEKRDLLPYIDSACQKELAIWSNDSFLQLADLKKVRQQGEGDYGRFLAWDRQSRRS